MIDRQSHRRRPWAPPVLGAIALVVLTLLAPSQSARAHSLDIYLQASYLTVEPGQIVVELDMSPGVLIAPQLLPELDSDGDQQISDAETQAYVTSVLSNVTLTVDDEALALTVTDIDMPDYLTIQAGYGTIRVFTSAALSGGLTGTHQIAYANAYAPTGSAYQVNAFVDQGEAVTLGAQNRDDIQQSMTVDFTLGGAGAVATGGETGVQTADAAGQTRRLLSYFDTPSLSGWQLLTALGLAVLLGGLHALTPGHGKTLVASYLVGSRGTVRHAMALGGIVTITHTASVIVIGLVALFASHWIMPDLLVPVLEIVSGALVVAMGARLAWQRWSASRSGRATAHNYQHAYARDGFAHHHGDGRKHSHLPPNEGIRLGSLIAMGISGGIVPCPEALGIMIIAVGLNRVALGLSLIVSFSLGLAAVLIGIGIALVRSRALVERIGRVAQAGRITRTLPLLSAGVVTLLGLGMTYRGLTKIGTTHHADLLGVLQSPWTLAVLASACGLFLIVERWWPRRTGSQMPSRDAELLALLPPRYRDGHTVSNAPMPAAGLVFDPEGGVAWNDIWGNFCDLALAGGPPHRDTVLQPAAPVDPVTCDAYRDAWNEIARGLELVTGWQTTPFATDGWIGLVCPSIEAARWLTIAITAENIAVHQDGHTIFLPVGAEFRLKYEIKNVVTAVAKTHHYWTEHDAAVLV
jgi:ABC-type nickel/cobalt efflux system permease component RcnA